VYPWLVHPDPARIPSADPPATARQRQRLALMVAAFTLLAAIVIIVVLPALGGPGL
jgi:hypothetical protein